MDVLLLLKYYKLISFRIYVFLLLKVQFQFLVFERADFEVVVVFVECFLVQHVLLQVGQSLQAFLRALDH